jgi:hypothetical protein
MTDDIFWKNALTESNRIGIDRSGGRWRARELTTSSEGLFSFSDRP